MTIFLFLMFNIQSIDNFELFEEKDKDETVFE
jgi:hypothetical protein